MRLIRRFLTRAANFFSRRDDRRLREEIEQHLALQTAANIRAGMRPGEARRQALLKFGGPQIVREDYRAEQRLPFVDDLLNDLAYAFRLLAKSRGFTAVAILTMAL